MTTRTITITVGGAVCALFLMSFSAHAQNLFVGSYGSQSIFEISGGTTTTFATGLNYPRGLAFNSTGDLFESDQFSGNIYEYARNGTQTTFESGLNQPNYMAFDSAGNLFVSVGGTTVDEFSPNGSLINSITDGLTNITGIAFNSAGNLFIANDNDFGPTDGYILEITPGGTESIFATGLNYPEGLAFNAAGDLFVCNGNPSSSIVEITPEDVQTTFATGLNGPNFIAFDSAGDMFVADAGLYNEGGDITEFASNGTVLNVNTSISLPVSVAFAPVTASAWLVNDLTFNVSGTVQYQNSEANLKGDTMTKTFNEKTVFMLISNAVANVAGYNVGLTPRHLPANAYIVFNPGDYDGGPEDGNGFFYVTNKSGFYFPLSGLDTNGTYYSYMELDSSVFYAQTATGEKNSLSFGFNEPFSGTATYDLNNTGSGTSTAKSSALLYIHDYPYDYNDAFSPNILFDINKNAIEIRGRMTTSLTLRDSKIKNGSITLTGGGNVVLDDYGIHGLVTSATATLR